MKVGNKILINLSPPVVEHAVAQRLGDPTQGTLGQFCHVLRTAIVDVGETQPALDEKKQAHAAHDNVESLVVDASHIARSFRVTKELVRCRARRKGVPENSGATAYRLLYLFGWALSKLLLCHSQIRYPGFRETIRFLCPLWDTFPSRGEREGGNSVPVRGAPGIVPVLIGGVRVKTPSGRTAPEMGPSCARHNAHQKPQEMESEILHTATFSRSSWGALWKNGWSFLQSALAKRHVISGIRQGEFRLVVFSARVPTRAEVKLEEQSALNRKFLRTVNHRNRNDERLFFYFFLLKSVEFLQLPGTPDPQYEPKPTIAISNLIMLLNS